MNSNPYWNLNLEIAVPMAVVTLLVSALIAWVLVRRRSPRARSIIFGLVLPLFLVFNPFSGWVVWEPVNKHLLTTMKEEAERVGLEGKTFPETRALFGEPGFVWGPDGNQVVTWNYPRPAFYIFGSKFQVHFKSGVVYGWEPYDD